MLHLRHYTCLSHHTGTGTVTVSHACSRNHIIEIGINPGVYIHMYVYIYHSCMN